MIVRPGADPRVIRLAFAGADGLSLDEAGNLLIGTAGGQVIQQAPVVYQEIGGLRRAVAGRYVLEGKDAVGFQVAGYDASRPLIIDPVLSYSTYLGGRGREFGQAITVDASGSVYVTGLTLSATPPNNFPTVGPLQPAPGGGIDAFVAKLNSAGSGFVYSTYLGGSGFEDASSIAVDGGGSAYLTGFTTSTNFPTVNAFQPTLPNPFGSAFVTKVNPTGSALAYSTYLGGSGGGGDQGFGITADTAGNALVSAISEAPFAISQ